MPSPLLETTEQIEARRQLKRDMSSWLTEQMNDLSIDYGTLFGGLTQPQSGDKVLPNCAQLVHYSTFKKAVRGHILQSLQAINKGLSALEKEIKKEFNLSIQADGGLQTSSSGAGSSKDATAQEVPLFKFYIKGGNAFKFTVEGSGANGTSDWDTQLLINPWLPVPITEEIYARVENTIAAILEQTAANLGELFTPLTEQGTQTSGLAQTQPDSTTSTSTGNSALNKELAGNPDTNTADSTNSNGGDSKTDKKSVFSLADYINSIIQYIPLLKQSNPSAKKIQTWLNNNDKAWMQHYAPVELKAGQIVKQFSHVNTGLWESSNSDIKSEYKNLPSVVESDRIAPFKIFRLGWLWKTKYNKAPATPSSPHPMEIKSILMELIDITIPRKYTIEAVTQWHEFIEEAGTEKATINDEMFDFSAPKFTSLKDDTTDTLSITLPFPNTYYHAHEQLIMLCEVADGSSEHKDKAPKRLARFGKCKGDAPKLTSAILDGLINKVNGQDINKAMSKSDALGFVGTLNLPAEAEKAFKDQVEQNNETDLRAVALMKQVQTRSEESVGLDEFAPKNSALKDQLNKATDADKINQFIGNLSKHRLVYNKEEGLQTVQMLGAAYSNDFVLEYIFNESNLISTHNIKSIGLPNLFFSRVGNRATLNAAKNAFISDFTSADKPAKSQSKAPPQFKPKCIVHDSFHSNRYTYFSTCLSFNESGKIQDCITFITANKAEAPFYQFEEAELAHKFYADLRLIAQQRKAMAALTMDYVLHTLLSNQVKAIYSLIGDN